MSFGRTARNDITRHAFPDVDSVAHGCLLKAISEPPRRLFFHHHLAPYSLRQLSSDRADLWTRLSSSIWRLLVYHRRVILLSCDASRSAVRTC